MEAFMVRNKIPQHFTASAITIFHQHVLLIHHPRIGAWLPPGGHIEEYELPHEAAVRETLEETGLLVEVISDRLPDTGCPHAFFMPQPLCLHHVPATEKGQDLYHLDIAYLCRPVNGGKSLPELVSGGEVKDACWAKISELDNLVLAKNVVEAVGLALNRLAP